jgi:RNA 2',3'-cyclic 3'-phosphodiesterase
MIRAFLSVELTEDLRAQIAGIQQDLKLRLSRELSKDVRVSWVQPSSLHLTVKFLGDTEEPLVEPMREAVERAMSGHRIICVPIERIGVFPRVQHPRVLWVGPSELWEKSDIGRRLTSLHQEVEACCRSFGFASDDTIWSPHLTLARVKQGERLAGQAFAKSGVLDRPLSIGSLVINALVLVKSELHPAGPVYTKLWEARLAEGE